MEPVITEEQFLSLLADAKLGRELRRFVEAEAREAAEADERVPANLDLAVGCDVDSALDCALVDLPDSIHETLAASAEAAARAVYAERMESRRDHAEADKDIARGLR